MANRHEKAGVAGTKTQTLSESTSVSPTQSPSSSPGAHMQTSKESPEANAYHPEMYRDTVFAAGTWRSGPVPVMFRFCWVLTGCMPFTHVITILGAWIKKGIVLLPCVSRVLHKDRKCRYMIQRYARKMHGGVFGEIVLNVCASVC